MSHAVQGVESEGSSEDEFSGVFSGVRKIRDEFYDVGAIECPRCEEVSDRETIQDYRVQWSLSANTLHKKLLLLITYER
jgi:hypothetical protein